MEVFSTATNFFLSKNNQRCSTKFLKCVIRIPSTLPIDPSTLADQEDKLQHIKYKLNYINKVIQPFYSLKLDSYLPKKASFVSLNGSPSKMMKNAFYFI